MQGTMSDIEPGEWFDRVRGAGSWRVIGPWPPKPDFWVVGYANDDHEMTEPPQVVVLPGHYLVLLRERKHAVDNATTIEEA